MRCSSVRSPRKHAVLRRNPALPLSTEKSRYGLFHARRAKYMRVAAFDENRTLRVLGKTPRQLDRSELIRTSATRPTHGSHRSAAPEVLSLAAPERATARSASSSSFSRNGLSV